MLFSICVTILFEKTSVWPLEIYSPSLISVIFCLNYNLNPIGSIYILSNAISQYFPLVTLWWYTRISRLRNPTLMMIIVIIIFAVPYTFPYLCLVLAVWLVHWSASTLACSSIPVNLSSLDHSWTCRLMPLSPPLDCSGPAAELLIRGITSIARRRSHQWRRTSGEVIGYPAKRPNEPVMKLLYTTD